MGVGYDNFSLIQQYSLVAHYFYRVLDKYKDGTSPNVLNFIHSQTIYKFDFNFQKMLEYYIYIYYNSS